MAVDSRNPEHTVTTVDVSLIIPCRNESGTIADCIRDARQALDAGGWSYEIVVCDNASSDESAARAADAGARVINQPIRGYGAAVLGGLAEARGEILVIVDGDGTYDLSVLHRFIEPLRAGYDMVLGTRRNGMMHPGAMRKRHRHLLEPLQTWMCSRFFAFRVSDVRCGFRSIRADALPRLDLGATGMEFASEMVIEAARAGLSSVEVPVSFHPRPIETSRRSVGDGWRVVRQLLLLSPTHLFLVPGLVLLLLGLGLELALLQGPIRLTPQFNLDFHVMFVGGGMSILGTQLLLLGLYAKTWALVEDEGVTDPWIRWLHLHYSLERGLLLGGGLFAAGLLVNVGILWYWLASGRSGDLFAVRPAVLALTLMVLGAEIVFASFFLSLLRGTRFGRV